MQRTVPRLSSDTISLFMRTYYSLLRTSDAIQIQALVESYLAMDSSLHVHARDIQKTDISTLVYTGLRLPSEITRTNMLLMGQTVDVFERQGYEVNSWKRVSAPARRRRSHFNGEDTLAMFISSRSDLDDLIPMLTAYQIEWNKVHQLLRKAPVAAQFSYHETITTFESRAIRELTETLGISREDLDRLEDAWGANLLPTLKAMAEHRKHFRVRLLAGSQSDYRRATGQWWAHLREIGLEQETDLERLPVYFVSSNLHSIVNLVSGFSGREGKQVIEFVNHSAPASLRQELEKIRSDDQLGVNEPNFIYYASKQYLGHQGESAEARKREAEAEVGITHVPAMRGFDVGAQFLRLNRLRPDYCDPRLLPIEDFDLLERSNALILNIDYPLGMAAYEILSHVSARVGRLEGAYIMGKAATLNGVIGDVMLPHVIHDEHSGNTYLFNNCFHANDLSPYMLMGSVLDNQKAITAYGTFLQNSEYMDVFYQEGYTILEMEGGPYLSAIYENTRPTRHPTGEIVRLYEATLDVGIIHYASDTPFSKGHNLGAGSLGYAGVEPTYAASIAIMRRILQREIARMRDIQNGKRTTLYHYTAPALASHQP
jgi:hypothetical protein